MQRCHHSPWAGGCDVAKKNGGQCYKPLSEGGRYQADKARWEKLYVASGLQAALDEEGNPPDANDYMPAWTQAEATHLMMYEEVSEGTPISPAFATPEELARWLVDNKAYAGGMGDGTASYEGWLRVARGGWAPSAVIANGVFMSGVEALNS